jgi:hypothetical protein
VTRAGRLVRGLAAAVALVAIVAGLPAALVVWGTSPVRGPLGWESLRDVFYELASERVLVGALTIAAWLVWALFLRALVAEIIDLRPGRPETLLAAGYGERQPLGRCEPWRDDSSRRSQSQWARWGHWPASPVR